MAYTLSYVRWIPVKVEPGMFRTESLAHVTAFDSNTYSFFVDKTLIREHGAQSLLKVYFASMAKKHARFITVLLPTETIETSSRWLNVAVGSVER
jgi:hypothetical protein